MYKRGVEGPVGYPALLYMTNDRGGYFKSVNHFGNLQGAEALYVYVVLTQSTPRRAPSSLEASTRDIR